MLKDKKFILDLHPKVKAKLSELTYSYQHSDTIKFLNQVLAEGVYPIEYVEKEIYNSKFSLKDINIQDVTLTSTDQVYLLPETKIPRYKFKEKSDEIGFKARRHINKCNIAVIDQKSLEYHKKELEYWRIKNVVKINKMDFYELLESMSNNHSLYLRDLIDPANRHIIEDLENDPDNFSMDFYYTSNSFLEIFKKFQIRYTYYYTSDYVQKESLSDDTINKLTILENLVNSNITITSSDCILRQITGDVELNDKMLQRLQQMLTSDSASRDLAMETITNLNYDRKLFELMMLLNKNAHTIRNSNIFNNISFKSFRAGLDSLFSNYSKDYLFNSNLYYTEYIQTLGSIKRLEKHHVDFFKDEIKRDFQHLPINRFFKVEKITANEVLVNYLKESAENLKNLKILSQETEETEEFKEEHQDV